MKGIKTMIEALLDFIFSTEFKVVLTCFAVLNGYIIIKMHTDKKEY